MSKKMFFLIIILILFNLLPKKINSINSNYTYPTYETRISSFYGYRELFGTKNFHNGIDFPVPEGTPIYSIQTGIVKSCSFIKGYGYSIIIEHYDGNKSLYAHLSEDYIIKVGQEIIQGQQIATVGPKYLKDGRLNGLTTGPHLHLSIFDNEGNSINPLSLQFI